MGHTNLEIKARCRDPRAAGKALRTLGADHHGTDHQIDTYFRVDQGRLKLRQGQIETALIHYHRPDKAAVRRAEVLLYHPVGPEECGKLLKILQAALDVLVVVRKDREIYSLDNVKFHVDRVDRLGEFVEIEAIDIDGNRGEHQLLRQCEAYMEKLGIGTDDLLGGSYSDMLVSIGDQRSDRRRG